MNTDLVKPLCLWYNSNRRDLPWRHTKNPYCIWVSEIMLQQTRVEAVKGYYERFLEHLPDIKALAGCPEDELLKLWEGLGYYNRVRNMQKAAIKIMAEFRGEFPDSYEEIRNLPGIGDYTAGAVASIAFSINKPAVDGNVMRVMARLENSQENILNPKEKKHVTADLQEILWQSAQMSDNWSPGDFNQALIELGALICLPNGLPKCEECPLLDLCEAHRHHTTDRVPVRIRQTKRKKEEKTVLLVRDGTRTAVRKRPERGLLAGLYEFPNLPGKADEKSVLREVKSHGLTPLHIRKIQDARHLFSHVEWQMSGYEIFVAEAEETEGGWIFADTGELERKYAVPSAFSAYAEFLHMRQGKEQVDKQVKKREERS